MSLNLSELQAALPDVDFHSFIRRFEQNSRPRTDAFYITNYLPVTFRILLAADASLDRVSILAFAKNGLSDRKLPYKEQQLYKCGLGVGDVESFMEAQAEILAVSFGEQEHRILTETQYAPFKPVSGVPSRSGGFGMVEQVSEHGLLFARKTQEAGEEAYTELNALLSVPAGDHLMTLRASYVQGHKHYLILRPWVEVDFNTFVENPDTCLWWKEAVGNRSAGNMVAGWFVCMAKAMHDLHRMQFRHQDITLHNVGLYRDDNGHLRPVLMNYGILTKFGAQSKTYNTAATGAWFSRGEAGRRKLKRFLNNGSWWQIPEKMEKVLALLPDSPWWRGFKPVLAAMLTNSPADRIKAGKLYDLLVSLETAAGRAVHCTRFPSPTRSAPPVLSDESDPEGGPSEDEEDVGQPLFL
ncbi:hypothetical protein HK097_011252 [Rhizophlyctis rosea]|uniref:Protein kinase domain-containing protein n=1 Tax=Rhizophlyctis rosea TaxID=64517 RepID=A0AAD5S8Y8_9FUNG|nr:hypothetical protein HK097_011252 [Rhizophlyctis rosea]